MLSLNCRIWREANTGPCPIPQLSLGPEAIIWAGKEGSARACIWRSTILYISRKAKVVCIVKHSIQSRLQSPKYPNIKYWELGEGFAPLPNQFFESFERNPMRAIFRPTHRLGAGIFRSGLLHSPVLVWIFCYNSCSIYSLSFMVKQLRVCTVYYSYTKVQSTIS